jgi:deoxyribonuclease V
MKALRLHPWNVTPREAVRIQLRLRERLELDDRLPQIAAIAGADITLDLRRGQAIAGVILYHFPEMVEIERVAARSRIAFPYVPGLLSFREIPALLKAFARLRHAPDLIFCDGQGYAHPRRFGLACHLGVLLDCPTIGCAKSILVGTAREPSRKAGAWAPLEDKGEVIGAALRTRDGVKPVYISQGHRISLERAIEFSRAVGGPFRIPRAKPIFSSRRASARESSLPAACRLQIKTGGEIPKDSTSRGGWGLLPDAQPGILVSPLPNASANRHSAGATYGCIVTPNRKKSNSGCGSERRKNPLEAKPHSWCLAAPSVFT